VSGNPIYDAIEDEFIRYLETADLPGTVELYLPNEAMDALLGGKGMVAAGQKLPLNTNAVRVEIAGHTVILRREQGKPDGFH